MDSASNSRMIHSEWREVFRALSANASQSIKVVCPFIKVGAAEWLSSNMRVKDVQILTRLSSEDFYTGVSDTEALRILLESGARVRGVRHLHSKLYLFDRDKALVCSTNLTESALMRNLEFGILIEDPSDIDDCHRYFDRLWNKARPDLNETILKQIDSEVKKAKARHPQPPRPKLLVDHGVLADIAESDDISSSTEEPTKKNFPDGQPADLVVRGAERTLDRFWSIIETLARSRGMLGTLTQTKKYYRIDTGIPGISFRFVAREKQVSTIELIINKNPDLSGSILERLSSKKEPIEREIGGLLSYEMIGKAGRIEKRYDYCGYANSDKEIYELGRKIADDMVSFNRILVDSLAKMNLQ